MTATSKHEARSGFEKHASHARGAAPESQIPSPRRAATLRAFGSPANIELVDTPLPEPGAGEVRVAVEASTVSATDALIG